MKTISKLTKEQLENDAMICLGANKENALELALKSRSTFSTLTSIDNDVYTFESEDFDYSKLEKSVNFGSDENI